MQRMADPLLGPGLVIEVVVREDRAVRRDHVENTFAARPQVDRRSRGRSCAAASMNLTQRNNPQGGMSGHTKHLVFVAGEAGEIIYSRLGGKEQRIGVSSEKHLTRALFTTRSPGWRGRDVYVNLDVGLIDIDNLERWTAEIRHVCQMGKMVDLSVHTISLALIGRDVRGTGAASGVAALFYLSRPMTGLSTSLTCSSAHVPLRTTRRRTHVRNPSRCSRNHGRMA